MHILTEHHHPHPFDKELPVLQPGVNCWRVSEAAHAAPLVDYANYYRALHQSIAKARKSIFILGWEIDSSTRLLRGEDEKSSPYPSTALDLLAWKARENPQLKIYLLRWDASIVFSYERELSPEFVWTSSTPENLQICLDNAVPIGGCHHQKIVVIDDELVFTGGMDIARQRWDERAHRPQEPERRDANGAYGPYHDVQIVADGPIVAHYAELVRWRWKRAMGYDPIPLVAPRRAQLGPAPTWPDSHPPYFEDIPCAIARTIPRLDPFEPEVREIRRAYLDLIAQAEHFIYIENQFLAYPRIARALRRQLESHPDLRVLLVSSHNPQGLFEREALWAARIDFKKILSKKIAPHRVRMVCSGVVTPAQGRVFKRIHSKVMCIDDKFLVIASSNLNRRSMTLDTESDLILEAANDEHRERIRRFRNDLIAEHCGRSPEQVGMLLDRQASFENFFRAGRAGSYSFMNLDDEKFTTQDLQPVIAKLADPRLPLVATRRPLRNPRRNAFFTGLLLSLLTLALFLVIHHYGQKINPQIIRHFLTISRHSPWAFPVVCLVYVVGGFVLFPVTLLSLITAAVFGSFWGPIYGLSGALLSASLMFYLGHMAGLKGLRRLLGDRVRSIDSQFRETGVVGVAILRFIPIAPFSLVNLAAGISSVRFFDFFFGSFLGFLPAFIAKGFVGDSLTQALLNPTQKTFIYLGIGVLLWLTLLLGSYYLTRAWRRRRQA